MHPEGLFAISVGILISAIYIVAVIVREWWARRTQRRHEKGGRDA
jgi:hypothetical protein